jgi:hypothetical protein
MPALLAKKILRDVLHGLAQFHALKCIHTGKMKPFHLSHRTDVVRWKISKPGTFSARLLPSPQDRPPLIDMTSDTILQPNTSKHRLPLS